MIINEKQFFTELLDLTIPEMKLASEAYESGDAARAEHFRMHKSPAG